MKPTPRTPKRATRESNRPSNRWWKIWVSGESDDLMAVRYYGTKKDALDKAAVHFLFQVSHLEIVEPKLASIEDCLHNLIDHPRHYTSHPSGVECITIIEHFTHNVGAAIKYLWRAGLKYPSNTMTYAEIQEARLEDLRKAKWYINREIQRRLTERENKAREVVND